MADKIDVEFGGSVDGLQQAAQEATSSIKSILAPIDELKSSFGTIGEAVAAAFGVEAVNKFFESMEQLAISTQRTMAILGVSAQTVEVLDAASKEVGGSLEGITMAMSRMSLGLARAEDGTGKEAAALKALNIDLKSFMALDTESKLKSIADAFSKLKDGMDKTAIAQALGRSFSQMIPLLNEGSAGIEHFAQMVQRAGSESTPEFLAAMKELHTATIELDKSWQGLGITLATEFSGTLTAMIKYFADLVQQFNNAIKAGGALAQALTALGWVFKNIAQFIVETIALFQMFYQAGLFAADVIIGAFVTLGAVIAKSLSTGLSQAGQLFKDLWEVVKAVVAGIGNNFIDLGVLIVAALSGNMGVAMDAFNRLKTNASNDVLAIGGAFTKLGQDATKSATEQGALMAAGWKFYLKDIQTSADNMGKNIDQIMKKANDSVVSIWKQGGDEIAKNDDKTTAHLDLNAKKRADDAIAAAMRQIAIIDQQFAAQTEQINHQFKMSVDFFGSAEAQKTSALKSSVQQRLAAEIAVLDELMAKYSLTSAQYAKLQDEKVKLTQKAANEIQKIENQAAEQTWQKWKSAADSIASSFSSGISSMVTGGKTFMQAMQQITRSLINQFINMVTKWAFEWIAKQLFMSTATKAVQASDVAGHVAAESAKTAATTASVAARTGAEATGAAAQSSVGILGAFQFIFAQAAKAFAGVFAFLSPAMGPAAAGPAAASQGEVIAVGSTIGAFDVGTDYVLRSGAAIIHEGEQIIPAATGTGPFTGANMGASITVPISISAWDGASVNSWLARGGAQILSKAVAKHVNLNPSGRAGY